MRKRIIIVSLIFIVIIVSLCSVEPAKNPKNNIQFDNEVNLDIINADNKLGLKLFKLINTTEENTNIFISPASIITAMGMVINGADGTTLAEIVNAFDITQYSLSQLNDTYAAIIKKIPYLDNKTNVSIANSIWYRQNFHLNSEFVLNTKQYFDAEIRGLNFYDPQSVKVINDWVKARTRDKIDRIIERISADDVMYLLNAIYFKGMWQNQFNKQATRDFDFHASPATIVKCQMMHKSGKFQYYEDDTIQAIDLPYGDDIFSMSIFLPKVHHHLDDVVSNLSYNDLHQWIDQFTSQHGTLLLPKFKIEYATSLNEYLQNIGIRRAFSASQAEFTKIIASEQFYISDVMHKSYIVVDEEGTEAAAVTRITMKATALDPNEFRMVVDHPFFFVIREKSTNLILFMGKVQNPVAS